MTVDLNLLDFPLPVAPLPFQYLTAAWRLKPDSDIYFPAPSGLPRGVLRGNSGLQYDDAQHHTNR